jgi:N-acyl-D-amino-acid deacylase
VSRVFDIVIKNALICDGSGSSPFSASLGIKDKKIIHVGKEHYESYEIIDADGLILAPGFIDTHAHSELAILSAPECESKILQGVTTEINGNCGLSAAPLVAEAKKRREADIAEFDIPERWSYFNEYFDILEKRRPAINFATLTGHGNIRASVKGHDDGKASGKEIISMAELAGQAIQSGSLGFSTGLIYPPGVFTKENELIMLLRSVANRENLVYASHMRSEGKDLLNAIKETLIVGRETGMKVHISHLKTGGKENWYKADNALEMIDDALKDGLRVTFDRYPYTGAATDLDIMLPSWAYEGGSEKEIERIKDVNTRDKIIEHICSIYKKESDYETILISSVMMDKNKWMEGKNILEISQEKRKLPWNTVLDILVEEKLRVGAIYMSMSEDNLKKFLKHPLCMIGSDSAVRNYSGVTAKGKPHPRGFGSMPRFLGKYVRDEGLMSIEEGVRRITSFPADTFGLINRGRIKEGYFADLVIFDPKTIIDTAVYGDPFQKPKGIEYVIVNGKIAVSHGELISDNRNGMILKR